MSERLAIFAEGQFETLNGKTGHGVIRYAPREIERAWLLVRLLREHTGATPSTHFATQACPSNGAARALDCPIPVVFSAREKR